MKNPVYPSVCIIRSVVKKKKSLSENYAEVYKKNTKYCSEFLTVLYIQE